VTYTQRSPLKCSRGGSLALWSPAQLGRVSILGRSEALRHTGEFEKEAPTEAKNTTHLI